MITKYKHKDGSETIIKETLSQQYDSDMSIIEEDRRKYSIIISSSVNCQMNCSFCGNSGDYSYLSSEQIIENVKDALIQHSREGLEDKYIKLCFMGMGDPSVFPMMTTSVPAAIIRFAINHGYACGLDGVDYGSILPWGTDKYFADRLISLNDFLEDQYTTNPYNEKKSTVRFFYSLHSAISETRASMIPKGNLDLIGPILNDLQHQVDCIMHYTPIYGVNDYTWEIGSLIKYMEEIPWVQLRMLRYNTNGRFQESLIVGNIWGVLSTVLPNTKFQISSGIIERSACGMFN